ncbi:MAG: hypothetical protein ACR5K7_00535 [Symbiopectobacterium sp.]
MATHCNATLSEIVVQLIEDAESKESYANQMSLLKQNLKAILSHKTTAT